MRARDTKAEELGRLELFRRCRKRDLRMLASIAEDVRFKPGQLLCQEGQHGYECFVIASGEAEVVVAGTRVAEVGPGDVVGEMAIVDGGPRTASVVALTEVHAFSIEKRRFDALLESAPAIARAMLKQLSTRLRRLDEDMQAARVA
jgi:CRP/FNR family transcriptional regulator, cyclic AMP receptor protein